MNSDIGEDDDVDELDDEEGSEGWENGLPDHACASGSGRRRCGGSLLVDADEEDVDEDPEAGGWENGDEDQARGCTERRRCFVVGDMLVDAVGDGNVM